MEQDVFTDNGVFRTEQIGDRDRAGLNHNFRAGVDYYFDEKTTLTLAGRYNIGDDNNVNTTTYLDFLDGNFLERTIRTDLETEAEEEGCKKGSCKTKGESSQKRRDEWR